MTDWLVDVLEAPIPVELFVPLVLLGAVSGPLVAFAVVAYLDRRARVARSDA